ncbi:MAG TPA: FAD-dependent tricarballylate dehydrogenase TcuA [Dehalococcoidia bacterium]|nr:FAD-dependent tricarballylate dehydrogenase TcuA [Dehalococcoidia bacterium]
MTSAQATVSQAEQGQGYDVIVVGAGNAALCAALSAREHGANVLVLEKAPRHLRGGNTAFTAGGFRFAYDGFEQLRPLLPDLSDDETAGIEVGSYPRAQYYDDLMRVTEGLADPGLVETLVNESQATVRWLQQTGVRWVLMYGRQAYRVEGKLRFWGGLVMEAVGGGQGLSDQEFGLCEQTGVAVRYGTKATGLLQDRQGRITGLRVFGPDGSEEIAAGAVVLGAGGFEANPEWRTRYLGQGWELAKVRGTRYNTGDAIRMALEAGAQPFGHWSGCHSVAWDLNAPPFGDLKVGDLFQKHSYPLGIIVNLDGRRFVDEGADFRNYTYVKYGRAILGQPQRTAFQLFDGKVMDILRDEYRIARATKATSDTIGGLAEALGIEREGLERTVDEYNAAVQDGAFNPAVLDGKGTRGIAPPKSNWAQRLDSPPYTGFAVTCGITFTFGGLRIDSATAQALDTEDRPLPGLYACGELVGGLFYHNYPGGAGLMSGAVFGRRAGASAATAALALRRA